MEGISQNNSGDVSIYYQLLKNRGIDSSELDKGLADLPDEQLLSGIEAVTERLRTALYNNEPLLIFGHDDPDGITSTYILYEYLNSCGYQKHNYYIPNRNLEPHGIQQSLIDFVREGGFKLVVTVDNGISASWGVDMLNQLGAEVIITDHHLIQPDQIPNAYAIINPQLPECKYPFKQLAGVGVVLLLIRYLSKVLEHPINPSSYFWTAVGSIADKVPMVGVNRIIVREAFRIWESINDSTIDFLLRNYTRISSQTDIFNFMQHTARLIANGRESNGQHTAIRFMLQVSDAKADLFQELEKQKNNWEHELNKVFHFMDTLIPNFVGNSFVYFDDEDMIPYNLLGTAATYVVNNLGIPTIMLKHHNGLMVCEGRCSDGFNIVSAFMHCKEHLIQFGGHPKAAGFTMQPANYNAFLDCFNEYRLNYIEDTQTLGGLSIDAEAHLHELNHSSWAHLEKLLPWGQKNPEPMIKIVNVRASDIQSRLSIDNQSIHIPDNGICNIIVQWKTPQSVKILALEDNREV